MQVLLLMFQVLYPSENINIISNNTYDATNYTSQSINIPVPQEIYNFSYYEMIYCQSTTRDDRQFTTGKIKYDCGSILAIGTGAYRAYDITINSDSSRTYIFENAHTPTGNIDNNNLIPVKIIFYKGEQ
jgi:hypothetical protein